MTTIIDYERRMFLYGMLVMGGFALIAVYVPDLFARWYFGV
jgi:hypothetical protein